MEAIYLLLAIGVIGYLFIAPIFGLLANGEARRAHDEIRKLKKSLTIMGQQLAALQQGGAGPPDAASAPAAPSAPEAPPGTKKLATRMITESPNTQTLSMFMNGNTISREPHMSGIR